MNRKTFTLTYPDGNTRAFTMSYDDGTHQDAKVMELCRKYHMGCTFAINSAFLDGSEGGFNHLGYDVKINRTTPEKLPEMYRGFEVAGHTATHPCLARLTSEQIRREVGDSKDYLSGLVGYEVRGMTYPMNSYDDRVCREISGYGVVYSRTTDETEDFEIPENFLKWHPTVHDHNPKALELVKKCVSSKKRGLKIFYVWGHAYEFDKPDAHFSNGPRWEDFEKLLALAESSRKFWCVSNIEVYDYIQASRKLVYGKDSVTNPSEIPIYGKIGNRKVVLSPGETVQIG